MTEENDEKKIQLAIYVVPARKKEIDDCIYNNRIRNYQDAYREILDLGFIQFQKKHSNKGGV